MVNVNVSMTHREAVAEVLMILNGIDLEYDPEQDMFQLTTRALNQALRSNAREREWSYYAETREVGIATEGESSVMMSSDYRLRGVGDDAIVLKDEGVAVRWAYILPLDALSKFRHRNGLWCAPRRNEIILSRPFWEGEDGLTVEAPVMREPRLLRMIPEGTSPDLSYLDTDLIDFDAPDAITTRAAFIMAQADPVQQPRVQTMEGQYKDVMYQLIERDERHTAPTVINNWMIPIRGNLRTMQAPLTHRHPHSDERMR